MEGRSSKERKGWREEEGELSLGQVDSMFLYFYFVTLLLLCEIDMQ